MYLALVGFIYDSYDGYCNDVRFGYHFRLSFLQYTLVTLGLAISVYVVPSTLLQRSCFISGSVAIQRGIIYDIH